MPDLAATHDRQAQLILESASPSKRGGSHLNQGCSSPHERRKEGNVIDELPYMYPGTRMKKQWKWQGNENENDLQHVPYPTLAWGSTEARTRNKGAR
jgi:hypothetical protein